MRKRLRVATMAPLALAVLAALLVLGTLFRPNPKPVSVPIDLRPGATTAVTFRSEYVELYDIGLEMDESTAKSLFPCTADQEAFALHPDACKASGTSPWPIKLSLSLTANGVDVSSEIRPSGSVAGGRYGGGRYTWIAGYVDLKARSTSYRLVVRSMTDGSALTPAHPQLIVEVEPSGFLEREMLLSFVKWIAAAALLVIAAAWVAIDFFLRRRRATPRP